MKKIVSIIFCLCVLSIFFVSCATSPIEHASLTGDWTGCYQLQINATDGRPPITDGDASLFAYYGKMPSNINELVEVNLDARTIKVLGGENVTGSRDYGLIHYENDDLMSFPKGVKVTVGVYPLPIEKKGWEKKVKTYHF